MSPASPVEVRVTEEIIPTYLPAAPDKHPMFLEKRVYQGSSGKVYPLAFTDRIAETKIDRAWKGVWLENDYLRVLVLPEIGGRIHVAQDKTNGYDFIYRQSVIKPALVGLAGPWISGGIEFNWPQHHRPATFLPAEFHVEEAEDGSKTVWLGDHDPLTRMKGMHGVCLHPGKASIELKVRAYNRTPFVQTFLWWANAAIRVHESYQSFFPPDVCYVADHAKRAMSAYPLCEGSYYGVDYGRRGREGVPEGERPADFLPRHCGGNGPIDYAANDLSWYANIPVPTSYMCMGTRENFFGGYDHARQAGVVHAANHHISPGKKQWTWGNHEFGYAWDRNLTDSDGPYIELMAGVYTDNQPDFSFLQPGETKTWSQFWYPIQQIGPAGQASEKAAVSLHMAKRTARIGVCVSEAISEAKVTLSKAEEILASFTRDILPGSPLIEEVELPPRAHESDLAVRLLDRNGREIVAYRPSANGKTEVPPPATEPPPPEEVASADELFVIGLHLEQYRHATRCPTLYWREALRRDPLDSRSNNALGLWHLRRGEFESAKSHFRNAIARLTARNPNPYDGEPFYNLGLCLRYVLDAASPDERSASELFDEAYAAFYKATWNQAWAAAGYHALAEMDCRRERWTQAFEHLDRSLRFGADNLRARDLMAVVLRKLGRNAEADALLAETLSIDPLDCWARHLTGRPIAEDVQTRLDMAHDYARAGLLSEAIALLQNVSLNAADSTAEHGASEPTPLYTQSRGAAPLVDYTLGWLFLRMGDGRSASECFERAAHRAPDYCFPARLEEIGILAVATESNPRDNLAPYYLGNLLYDRRRRDEAIALWERSVKIDPNFSIAWRNLGIGYFNVHKRPEKARTAYDRAFRADPANARLLFERDQLWKRLGVKPALRLRELEKHPDLVRQRDDLSVELCTLYVRTGRPEKSLEILSAKNFQPWEGGEGQTLAIHARSRIALGQKSLREGDASAAIVHFRAALEAPRNLGEANHLLANRSDIHYRLGCAHAAFGEKAKARECWRTAAIFRGDFQEMSVRVFSEMTYFSALSLQRLGQKAKAKKMLDALLSYAKTLQKTPAKIDYFATSLPAMLLFDDDIQYRQETTALFLQAQSHLGLRRKAKAKSLLEKILTRDPNHAPAAELMDELR
jgi:tetratricopeptide (TPR) repeat protein